MAIESDYTKHLRRRESELRTTIEANKPAALKQRYDEALAVEEGHRESNQRKGWGGDYADPASQAIHARTRELNDARNAIGSAHQAAVSEAEQATNELREITQLLNAPDTIKTERRALAEARQNERDLRETIESHAALLQALPQEITALLEERKTAITVHAAAEARARATQGATLPPFPSRVRDLDLTIETKRATATSATETLTAAKASLPAAREAADAARARLQHAIHYRDLLAWKSATATLGGLAAAVRASGQHNDERLTTITPTPAEVATAEASLLTELAS